MGELKKSKEVFVGKMKKSGSVSIENEMFENQYIGTYYSSHSCPFDDLKLRC
jgi:hypothetical protein